MRGHFPFFNFSSNLLTSAFAVQTMDSLFLLVLEGIWAFTTEERSMNTTVLTHASKGSPLLPLTPLVLSLWPLFPTDADRGGGQIILTVEQYPPVCHKRNQILRFQTHKGLNLILSKEYLTLVCVRCVSWCRVTKPPQPIVMCVTLPERKDGTRKSKRYSSY